MSTTNNDNLFTFIWKIENFRMADSRRFNLDSPDFVIAKFFGTKWNLELYAADDWIPNGNLNCYLYRYSRGPNEIRLNFKIFATSNFSRLPKLEDKSCDFKTFGKSCRIIEENIKCCDYLSQGLSPNNSIYIICYMWMDEAEIKNFPAYVRESDDNYFKELKSMACFEELLSSFGKNTSAFQKESFYFPKKCFARSIVSVERKVLSWSLRNITNSEERKSSILVMSSISSSLSLLVTVVLNEDNFICFSVQLVDKTETIRVVCKCSIFNHNVSVCHLSEYESYISAELQPWKFELPCKTTDLTEEPLLSDLYLYCEMFISEEEATVFIDEIPTLDLSWCHDQIPDFGSSCSTVVTNRVHEKKLQLKMKNMYTSKQFTDVIFRLETVTLSAHKAVLCVNSPVFKAMLQTDMRENKASEIPITDIKASTFDRLLMFMYTECLDHMEFEEVIDLYEAADKYQVLSLRTECANLILADLSLRNACSILCLADARNDADLRSAVKKYILHHAKEVLVSDEWKELRNIDIKLKSEILEEICFKLLNIQID